MLIMYLTSTWFISFCYSFVIISSAAAGPSDLNLFHPSETSLYHLDSTILFNEKITNDSKTISFSVKSEISVNSFWQSEDNNEVILKLEVNYLKLSSKVTYFI